MIERKNEEKILKKLYDHNTKVHNCDRFIPSRKHFDVNHSYHAIFNSDSVKNPTDILEQNPNEWPVHNYETSLNSLIKNNLHTKRILPFGSNLKCADKENHAIHWPVKARQKPIIGSPWAVLDLPNFINAFDRNLLDWGKCNYIAAALWDSVYLWNACTSKTVPIPNPTTTAIKWNPDGSSLFTANRSCIKIWDMETTKAKMTFNQGHCAQFRCSVTAVDWFPFGNVQVAGCDHGGVVIHNEDGFRKVINQGQGGNIFCSIVTVNFSYNGRYIASSSFESVVNVWTFPDGLLYFKIKMFGSTRGMAWHPVRQSYLCLGDTSGVMALWNVSNQTTIAQHKPMIKKAVAVYCLTFSELSGELVTSHLLYNHSDQTWNVSQLNVLASFERVVDRIEGKHDGRILYLKWSPDGTQFATAGSDETLQIWNFTNLCSKNSKKYKRSTFQGSKDIFLNEKFSCVIR